MSTITTEQFSELTGCFCDAAVNPALWPESVNRIRRALSGSAALLFTPLHAAEAGGVAFPSNLPADFVTRYASRHQGFDIWMEAMIDKGLLASGVVVSDEELVPRRQLLSSTYYRDVFKPMNISRACTSVLFGQDEPAHLPTVISIYRRRAPSFSNADKELLHMLSSHLSRSLRITYHLRNAEQKVTSILAALDRLTCGIVFFDAAGNVVHTNQSAKKLFAENDGLSLDETACQVYRLKTPSAFGTTHLNNFIASGMNRSAPDTSSIPHSIRIPKISGKCPIVLSLSTPLTIPSCVSKTCHQFVTGFLIDTAAPLSPEDSLLSEVFSLTPAEIRIIHGLGHDMTIYEIAVKHGGSVETARKQLRSTFSKTGTNRQSELLKLASALSIKVDK